MRKYHVSHEGEGSTITLIRREYGVDTTLAVFYPEVGYTLSRAICNLIAAAQETGRKEIFILQIPTSQGRIFDTRLMADCISTAEGTEIDVAFYRKVGEGEECVAHVFAGVNSEGSPRVRIKSVASDGGKRYLEISLAGKGDKPVDEAPTAPPAAEAPKAESEPKAESPVEKPAEKPAEVPTATPSQA